MMNPSLLFRIIFLLPILLVLLFPTIIWANGDGPEEIFSVVSSLSYDSDGQKRWQRFFNVEDENDRDTWQGFDSLRSLGMDQDGMFYIVAGSYFSDWFFSIIKHNQSGDTIWKIDESSDIGSSISIEGGTVIPSGGFYLVATYGEYDEATSKLFRYSASGEKTFDLELPDVEHISLLVSNSGHLYLTYYNGTDSIGVTVLDENDNTIWEKTYQIGNPEWNYGAFTVDDDDNLYIAWNFRLDNNENDKLIVGKIDPAGNHLWENIFPLASQTEDLNPFIIGNTVVVDKNKNLYVATSFGSPHYGPVGDESALIKYSEEGEILWIRYFNGGSYFSATALALDSEDNILLAGGAHKYFVLVKYDPYSSELWSDKRSSHRYVGGTAMAVDQEDNITLLGAYSSGYMLLHYSMDGERLWTVKKRPKDDFTFDVYGPLVDTEGNFYLSGTLMKWSSDGNDEDNTPAKNMFGCNAGGGDAGATRVLLTLVMLAIGFGARFIGRTARFRE